MFKWIEKHIVGLMIVVVIIAVVTAIVVVTNPNSTKTEETQVLSLDKLHGLWENLLHSEKSAINTYFAAAEKLHDSVSDSATMAGTAAQTADEAARIAADSARKAANACELSEKAKNALKEMLGRTEPVAEEDVVAPAPDVPRPLQRVAPAPAPDVGPEDADENVTLDLSEDNG